MWAPRRRPVQDDAPPPYIEAEEDGRCGASLSEYDVVTSPTDYSVEALCGMMESRELVLPDLRAGWHAWDRRTASRFVESLIVGLPVPPVFLLKRRGEPLLAIDGFRRLKAVGDFFSGRHGDGDGDGDGDGGRGSEFRLAGIGTDSLSGRTFSDLGVFDRRALECTVIRAIIVRQTDPDRNPAVAHDIFERLNSGAMRLCDQEARDRVYPGRLNDLIDELNASDDWRALLQSPRADRRQRDAELILRYMALFHDLAEYKNPMKIFLSAYMQKNRNPPDAFIRKEQERFARTCRLVLDRLGGIPLDGNNRISPSLFDAVFVTVAQNPDACGDGALPARLRRLMSDPSFIECITCDTAGPRTVRRRLSLARSGLCG